MNPDRHHRSHQASGCSTRLFGFRNKNTRALLMTGRCGKNYFPGKHESRKTVTQNLKGSPTGEE